MRQRGSGGVETAPSPTTLAKPAEWLDSAELKSKLPEAERRLRVLLEFSPSSATTEKTAEDWDVEGRGWASLGEWAQAASAYAWAARLAPKRKRAPLLFAQGVALGLLGRHAEALAAFDHALALRPDLPEAHSNRGVALAGLGRHADALAAYDRALALRPDLPAAHYNRGNALASLGRYEESLAAYDRALALRPDYPEAHSNRGNALGRMGRYEESLAACDRALALRPDLPEAHSNRGVALGRLGRHADALAAYDRALALRPDHSEALFNKACALSRLERGDEALRWLEQAIARDNEWRVKARTDPDLAFLLDHPDYGPRFRALVGEQTPPAA